MCIRDSYHVYTYTSVLSKANKTKPGKLLSRLLPTNPIPRPKYQSPPPDDDIHRYHELFDMIDRPVNTNDYTPPPFQNPEPTCSVVEIHKPCLPPPQSEEAITRKVPGTTEADQTEVDKNSKVQNHELEGNIKSAAALN